MTRRSPTNAERIAGLREVIRAANGNWHDATALYSVQDDLTWLLARATLRVRPIVHTERESDL